METNARGGKNPWNEGIRESGLVHKRAWWFRNWECAVTNVCIGGSFRRREIVRIIYNRVYNKVLRKYRIEILDEWDESASPIGHEANFTSIVSSILARKRLAELRSIDPYTFPSVRLPRVFIGRLDGRLLLFYPYSSLKGSFSNGAQKTNPFLRLFFNGGKVIDEKIYVSRKEIFFV